MKASAAKIGAAFYVLWGALHFLAAYKVQQLAAGMPAEMAVEAARVTQNAWHLAIIAGFAVVIAVKWNWRNDMRGYWLNLWLVSGTDVGFIFLVLLPGYFPAGLGPGLVGPAVWALAVVFSTIGYRQQASAAAQSTTP